MAQLIIGHLDFGRGPQGAISAPRMDCSEGRLLVDDRFGSAALDALAARGHTVVPIHNDFFGGGFASPTAIAYAPDGTLRGGADQFFPSIAIGV